MKVFKFLFYLLVLWLWLFLVLFIFVVLGVVICWKIIGNFSFILFFLIMVVVFGVYVVGNLVNIYYDFMKGVDSKVFDDCILVDYFLMLKEVVNLGVVLYGFFSFVFVFLVGLLLVKMEYLLFLFFGGFFGLFLYIGGVGLKYYGVGDIVIVIIFGFLVVLFFYLI